MTSSSSPFRPVFNIHNASFGQHLEQSKMAAKLESNRLIDHIYERVIRDLDGWFNGSTKVKGESDPDCGCKTCCPGDMKMMMMKTKVEDKVEDGEVVLIENSENREIREIRESSENCENSENNETLPFLSDTSDRVHDIVEGEYNANNSTAVNELQSLQPQPETILEHGTVYTNMNLEQLIQDRCDKNLKRRPMNCVTTSMGIMKRIRTGNDGSNATVTSLNETPDSVHDCAEGGDYNFENISTLNVQNQSETIVENETMNTGDDDDDLIEEIDPETLEQLRLEIKAEYNGMRENNENNMNGINEINGINQIEGTNGINGIDGTNGINEINNTNEINGINEINKNSATQSLLPLLNEHQNSDLIDLSPKTVHNPEEVETSDTHNDQSNEPSANASDGDETEIDEAAAEEEAVTPTRSFTRSTRLRSKYKIVHEPEEGDSSIDEFDNEDDVDDENYEPICDEDEEEESEFEMEIQRQIKVSGAQGPSSRPPIDKNGPFPCGQCQRVFQSRRSFREHTFRHTGAWPFRCVPCDRGFARRCIFEAHARTHASPQQSTRDIPGLAFACTECDKRFRSAAILKCHIRWHRVDEPGFTCGQCEQKFKWKRHLSQHILYVHTIDRTSVVSVIEPLSGHTFERNMSRGRTPRCNCFVVRAVLLGLPKRLP